MVNIFVYSDESGVFDREHNRYFVFGGLIFLDKESRDLCARKYTKAEKDIRTIAGMMPDQEVKASNISNALKGKLFRSLNNQIRFGVVVDETRVIDRIWHSKKDKQRFLDYVYKIAVKRILEQLIETGDINPDEVENMYFFVDEHTTATNGRYELEESLEQEFKSGTYNYNWSHFYPPIFPNMKSVSVKYCNSSSTTLVRAADIIANRIYFFARSNETYSSSTKSLHVIRLP